jgi:hypothetical protein
VSKQDCVAGVERHAVPFRTMRKRVFIDGADVLGASRLAVDGTSGVIGIVEAIHSAVLNNILPDTRAQSGRRTGWWEIIWPQRRTRSQFECTCGEAAE